MAFFSELKRRNVFRVAGVYTVVGWLLVQVAGALEEAVNLPEWFDGMVVSLLLIGFPLALIFAWAFELTPDGLKPTASVDPSESITQSTASSLDIALIVALLGFGAVMLGSRFLGGPATEEVLAASEAVMPAQLGAEEEASIAVLPFADLSKAQDQEYFADGISEELLNVLAKVRGMKVAGRTSSFAFKGRNEDLREIGNVLGVAHILEGSVRSQGDKVRVTAQLIQVSDGFHLWSETYDRDLTDIFAVQDDIAEKILVAMKERLMSDTLPTITPVKRTDISAYNLFLEARDLVFTRTLEPMERALALLNEVIDTDPEYAPAYALRAKALTLLSDRPGSYGSIPAKEALTRSRADVDKALELDPELADAHAVLGLINADLGRPDFAISSLRRALELNPNSLDARNWLAIALSANGRLRDVTDQLKTLVEIDPLYRPGVTNTISYSIQIGDLETARRVADNYRLAATTTRVDRIKFEADMLWRDGECAQAIRVMERLSLDELDRVGVAELRNLYIDLGIVEEYQGEAQLLPVFAPFEPINRGQFDAAIAMANANVDEFPDFFIAHRTLVEVLSISGKDKALADYFDREYEGNIELFSTRLRPAVSVDSPPYGELAQAMKADGRDDVFAAVIERWRFNIDIFRAGGDVSAQRDLEEARLNGIQGNALKAMEYLELASTKYWPLRLNLFADRAFELLRDDPRFIDLRARNMQRVNEERAKLGYEPVALAYYDRFKRS